MASEPSVNEPQSSNNGSTLDELTVLTVNLQVLSPSVGVNRPLLFPSLPASTTVKQLKERIRQTLPLRPADDNQRLIHRGRAIVRESDTLEDIFGEDAFRSPDQQTIHLVIRDAHETHTPTPPASIRGPSPTAQGQPPNVRPTPPHNPYGPQPPPAFARRNPMPATTNPFPQPRLPSPSPIHTPEQAAAFQHHHQNMTQWLSHIQREAMARAMMNQNQRNRAQMGMRPGEGGNAAHVVTQNAAHNGAHTAGYTVFPNSAPTTADNSGRASPAPSQTIYREHIGPNGHTYQVETIIRSSAPPTPNGGMMPAEVANLIRGADANQAALAMTNAMQRSISNASQRGRPVSQPPVTNHTMPPADSTERNGRETPEMATGRSTSTAAGSNTTPGSSQANQGLEVYVLSSPDGPRALLINHSNLETYWTPRLRSQASHPQLRYPAPPSNLGIEIPAQARPRHHHHHHHHHPRNSQQQQQPQQQQQHGFIQPPQPPPDDAPPPQVHNQAQLEQQNPPAVGIVHPANPPVAAAIPALLLQLWPQIWLLFRLALFVWFFTSPDASWSRWFTIITVAVFVFVMSTGVLNGLGDLARRVLGRHLENMIPPLENLGRPRRAEQGQGDGAPDPNPAVMAARLVAERNGPASWLTTQARRVERASLLFLASIAPGVAERHIANLEAQERADRLRREAEAAEAARQAELAAENNENMEHAGDDTQNDGDEEKRNVDEGQSTQSQPHSGGHGVDGEEPEARDTNRGNEPQQEQLIEI